MVKQHQIFIGCPFLTAIRKNYDKLKTELEQETPLHVVLADTTAVTSTDYLLENITGLIRESAACVFDVTGGNPNVSLEVGVAHALPADFLLALYTRKPRSQRDAEQALQREGEVKPIISDLQGRNRIEYKRYTALKSQLLARYLDRLPYLVSVATVRNACTSHYLASPSAVGSWPWIRGAGRENRGMTDTGPPNIRPPPPIAIFSCGVSGK